MNTIPGEINVFIEISQAGNIKYELDEKSGKIFVDRFMYTAMNYPFNYGSIMGTRGEDGDPLDALVIASHPVMVGSILKCRPIGLLQMQDEEGIDTKILAVPTVKIDPFLAHITDIADIQEATQKMIKHFFEHYKELEPGKWVKIKEWKGRNVAEKEIEKSINHES